MRNKNTGIIKGVTEIDKTSKQNEIPTQKIGLYIDNKMEGHFFSPLENLIKFCKMVTTFIYNNNNYYAPG